jgi:transcriptional regulator with GAF, ATPase, and Fis domain
MPLPPDRCSPEDPVPVADLCAVVLSEHPLEELVGTVARLALSSLASADGASVVVCRDGRLVTSYPTDETVRRLEAVQQERGVGPTLDAIRAGSRIALPLDPSHRSRYPSFAEAAADRSITAVLALPLLTSARCTGALTLYSTSVRSFPEEQVARADAVAGRASVLLANATDYAAAIRLNRSLRDALLTRELIGEAKGIIMANRGCSPEEAFEALRTHSQHENRKLHAIARELVASVQRGASAAAAPAERPEPDTSTEGVAGPPGQSAAAGGAGA